MSVYPPPTANPIFNKSNFPKNDLIGVLDGLTASAKEYIDEKILSISGEIIDLSGSIITIIEDISTNTAQISLNSGAISIIEGGILTLASNVDDLSSQVLDLSTNTAKLNAGNTFTENNTFQGDKQFIVNITPSATSAISFLGREVNIQNGLLCGAGPSAHIDAKISGVLSVNQIAQGGTDDRALNYITTPKVEITTEPVDLSDATTKNYVDNAIAGVVPDLTNYARLDISNTFQEKQTFLDKILSDKCVANKFLTDNNGEELVYGNYSNTFYVNDNETGTSGSINDTLALITSANKVIRISAGSYSQDVLVSGKTLVGLSCPNIGGITMTELAGTRTFTIENSYRIRVSGLQINGMTTISGSQLRHRLEVCNFNGGLTITGGGATPLAEFMTIQDCDIAGSLTISSFTGIVYFYRVNFQNSTFNISPAYSPQQVIMIDCAGIPDDVSLFAGNYYVVGSTSYYKSGTLTTGDFNSSFFVRNTTPSQDNELASKLYVDTAVATNTSAIATNTSAISDLSANKQDTLTAGTNITIVGTTISSSGGGSGSSQEYFMVKTARVLVASHAITNSPRIPFDTLVRKSSNVEIAFSDTGKITLTGSGVDGLWDINWNAPIIFGATAEQFDSYVLQLTRAGVTSNHTFWGWQASAVEGGSTQIELEDGDTIFWTFSGVGIQIMTANNNAANANTLYTFLKATKVVT